MEASASEPTAAAEEAASPSAAMSLQQAEKLLVPHAAKAWEFFRSIGSPKFHVAPMVDQVSLLARSCMAAPRGSAWPLVSAYMMLSPARQTDTSFQSVLAHPPLSCTVRAALPAAVPAERSHMCLQPHAACAPLRPGP